MERTPFSGIINDYMSKFINKLVSRVIRQLPIMPKMSDSFSILGLWLFTERPRFSTEENTTDIHIYRTDGTLFCFKITQNVAFGLGILEFSDNFCPIKIDLSGNTV